VTCRSSVNGFKAKNTEPLGGATWWKSLKIFPLLQLLRLN